MHVLRREEEYIGKRLMVMEVSEKMEVSGKRGRGRPKWRWLDRTRNDWQNGGKTYEPLTPHKNGK